jgi:hypothetical protein
MFACYGQRLADLNEVSISGLTIAMGALRGFLVTFSSVGAAAIGVTAVALLYPRILTTRIIGSDIAHAVPLTLIAGKARTFLEPAAGTTTRVRLPPLPERPRSKPVGAGPPVEPPHRGRFA